MRLISSVVLLFLDCIGANIWERLMNVKLCSGRVARLAMVMVDWGWPGSSAKAETLLIDFGRSESARMIIPRSDRAESGP